MRMISIIKPNESMNIKDESIPEKENTYWNKVYKKPIDKYFCSNCGIEINEMEIFCNDCKI